MDYPSAMTLNAWTLPSNIRHDVIFRVLDALPPYQAVTLINDHDPKPLFYQLDAEQPGVFARETVNPPRPDFFAVLITRRPKAGEITLLS
jgi:uncharacterized protein (DUF2249 family)